MRLSIKWIIILGSFLLVWGTHLIITPSSYFSSERVLTRHVQDIMKNIVDLTLEQSNNHLNKAKSAAYLAKQLLSADVVGNDSAGQTSLERYFFNQLSIYPHLSGIYYATLNGDFIFVSRTNEKVADGYRTKIIRIQEDGKRTVQLFWYDSAFNRITEKNDPTDTYDPRKRPWFTEVLRKQGVIWTEPYIFYTSQKPGITIAGPSLKKDGSLKGIVGVDIEISELSTFISKLRVGKSGLAFMLNRNGDVIAYRDLEQYVIHKKDKGSFRLPKVNEIGNAVVKNAFKSIEWSYDDEGFLKLDKPVLTSFQKDNEKYISIFAPFPDKRLPWIVAVYIPEHDYLAEIRHNRFINTLATFAISLLASLLGLSFARRLVTPIENLRKEAKAIEENDLQTTFNNDSIFEELQETADSFSRMKKALVSYKSDLIAQERLHRAITDTANDAIIMTDEEHQLSFWNPAAQTMFGYTAQEVLGTNIYQVLAPSAHLPMTFSSEMGSPFDPARLDGKTIEATVVRKNGQKFPVEISVSQLHMNGTRHSLAIIRDISERVHSEAIKKRLAHDLHDGIGGNLTNIKLLSEMLLNQTEDSRIQEALITIADISTDCISETRNYMGALDKGPLNWQNLIDELQHYCVRVVEAHGITLSVSTDIGQQLPPPSTFLYMNLFRMIKEAVNNAVKHSGADTIWFNCTITKKEFLCSVRDNGKGLAPKVGSGRGLLSMQTRANELGGICELQESDGIVISIRVPITRDETINDAIAV